MNFVVANLAENRKYLRWLTIGIVIIITVWIRFIKTDSKRFMAHDADAYCAAILPVRKWAGQYLLISALLDN